MDIARESPVSCYATYLLLASSELFRRVVKLCCSIVHDWIHANILRFLQFQRSTAFGVTAQSKIIRRISVEILSLK
jgi:hypothetical protein